MTELTPTRSLLIALADERRTMREGYAFLDEKCLLLAGEMLRQVKLHRAVSAEIEVLQRSAAAAMAAALGRHGLHGLQVYPRAPGGRRVRVESKPFLGVITLSARIVGEAGTAPSAVFPSPEAEACRSAYVRVGAKLVELAALSTTLARLHAEYRRTVRRVRALQDVLLPELDRDITSVGASLEDLEREEAIALRWRH